MSKLSLRSLIDRGNSTTGADEVTKRGRIIKLETRVLKGKRQCKLLAKTNEKQPRNNNCDAVSPALSPDRISYHHTILSSDLLYETA